MSETGEVDRDQANLMAGRICAAAGLSAQSECELLERIGEFDAVGAIRWWVDVKSLAHWLSWCCSMTAGTAREHVRVARAMRRMPTVTAAFREGRLSYSKVREVTRVVDVLDEEQLCRMALTATASQLARMLSGYRSSAGSRIRQEGARALSWHERDDGMIDFRMRMPKEEAALVIAALTAAKDQFGAPPPAPCPELPTQPNGRSLADSSRGDSSPADSSPADSSPADSSPADSLSADSPSADSLSTDQWASSVAGPISEPDDPAGDDPAGDDPAGDASAVVDGRVLDAAVRYPLAERRARARRQARAAVDVAVDSTPTYGYADAIVDVARVFLDTAPEDRSGEDRTVVMVHVAAEHLTSPTDRPPGGTRYPTDLAESLQASTGVPVGTPPSDRAPATGSGPIQPNPVRSSPVQSNPVRPARSSPARSSPARSSPTRSSPARSSPARSSTARSSPARSSTASPPSARQQHAEPSTSPAADLDVPAGTPMRPAVSPGSTIDAPPTCSDPTCQLQGLGGIEPETSPTARL